MHRSQSLEVIRDRLESDKTWRNQTLLEVDDVIELQEFILSCVLSLWEQINRHKFGTAMGSPVSPLVFNLYMCYESPFSLMVHSAVSLSGKLELSTDSFGKRI